MARTRTLALGAALAVAAPLALYGVTAPASAHSSSSKPKKPDRVLIVLFDQMVPQYADQFAMPNFRKLRGDGTYFKDAYLGYTASETVMAHNIIMSGQLPKNMGWTDEAYRDTDNLLGNGTNSMNITGDLSLSDFGKLINGAYGGGSYKKLADYLHAAQPGQKFIVVGEKSYAVESAAAPNADIAVRLASRASVEPCKTTLGGQYRYPKGKNVPTYLAPLDPANTNDPQFCNRFYINADKANDYGTRSAFPSYMYPEEGNRFFRGTDPSAAEHPGGDVWAADAAIAMMNNEQWSGMFVTLGGIDKAGHMWGAQHDAATFKGSCTVGTPAEVGAAQTHVRCAAEEADKQLGKLMSTVKALDKAQNRETLVVLTADHGATYGETYYGKDALLAGDSNWYWAPNGVYDGGAFDDVTYNSPSPALLPLNADGNLAFSYQSTEIEAWLTDTSLAKKQSKAQVMLGLPGVTAAYYRDGSHYVLVGTNAMTKSEKKWWTKHGQELVDSMAVANGPDVLGLLHDKTSYGVYGDHGGTQESVQRIPIVFWSKSLAAHERSDAPIRTVDIMPTILKALGIKAEGPIDGRPFKLDD